MFKGGLHDRDVGWVRFGYRDYDPETGRFTALDPIGYASGDSDLYGYCLDDPVNLVDPEGTMPWLLPFAVGKLLSTTIGAVGAYGAATAADAAGKARDEDYGKNEPTATEGVTDAMGKVGIIQAGQVATAAAAAGGASALGVAARKAPALGAATKGLGDKIVQEYDATKSSILSNPDKVATAGDFISGAVSPGPPQATPGGYA